MEAEVWKARADCRFRDRAFALSALEDIHEDAMVALKRSGGFREGHERDMVASAAEVAGFQNRAAEACSALRSGQGAEDDPKSYEAAVALDQRDEAKRRYGYALETLEKIRDLLPGAEVTTTTQAIGALVARALYGARGLR